MGIKLTSPPPGGIEAVSDALQLLAQARPSHQADLAGSGAVMKRQLISPQEVYQIPLDKMAKKNPLQSAVPVAWRYLVIEGEQPIEVAETTLGGSKPISFSQVNRGPQVDGFVEAVRIAETIATEQPASNWEMRYLRIPALYVDALWLYDSQGEHKGDLLIPVQPVFPPLQANRAYSASEFFQQIRKRAVQRLQSSDETNG